MDDLARLSFKKETLFFCCEGKVSLLSIVLAMLQICKVNDIIAAFIRISMIEA